MRQILDLTRNFILLLCIALFLVACEKSNDPPPPLPEPKDTLLNWKKLPDPTGTNAYISDVWFANSSTGIFVSGAGILKSNDGGSSWTKKNFANSYLANIQFLSSQIGFVQGQGTMAYTLDAGDSWHQKNLTIIPESRDIFFISPTTGYLIARGGLYKTIDTGNLWKKLYDKPTYAVFFLDNIRGFIYADNKILKTENGGDTWQSISDLTFPGYTASDWYTLQFTDDKTGMLAGRKSFARTSDGGANWSLKQFNDRVTDIHFMSKDIGYLSTTNEIYKTIDGGTTWIRSCKIAKPSIIEIYFTNLNTGWAVGEGGLLLQTQ